MCSWATKDEEKVEVSGIAFLLEPIYNVLMWALLKLSRIIER